MLYIYSSRSLALKSYNSFGDKDEWGDSQSLSEEEEEIEWWSEEEEEEEEEEESRATAASLSTTSSASPPYLLYPRTGEVYQFSAEQIDRWCVRVLTSLSFFLTYKHRTTLMLRRWLSRWVSSLSLYVSCAWCLFSSCSCLIFHFSLSLLVV